MAYPHALRIEGLLSKLESTYATDPTPSNSTDGVRGVGRLWVGVEPEFAFPNLREDTVSNSLVGVAPGTPAGSICALRYTVQLMGAGAAYSSSTPVRPECDALLMSCGFARTHTDTGGSERVDYDLADTGHASSTNYVYAGGKRFNLTGCRGNMTWRPQAGGLGQIEFDIMGLLATTPSEVATPSITYDSVVPPPAVGMGLSLNAGSAWTPRTREVEITTGHRIERLDDVSSADGIERFEIAETNPRLRFQARAVDTSDYNPWSLSRARTVHTVDLTLGSTQYNRAKLDCELAYLIGDPSNVDEQGFAATALEYMLRDLQLTFD